MNLIINFLPIKFSFVCIPELNENWKVLKMEVQVLKYFNFQLFAPTAKSFLRYYSLSDILACIWDLIWTKLILHVHTFSNACSFFRRFLRAAQASYKVKWRFYVFAGPVAKYANLLVRDLNFLIPNFAESQSWTRVFGQLFGWTYTSRLWLLEFPTVCCRSISHISRKMDVRSD